MSSDIATLPALLPYALEYAARGWLVFPIHTPDAAGRCSCGSDCGTRAGKHPRCPHGLRDGTTDPGVIKAWWTKWPDANIGIQTGEKSGLLVVDVDPKNAGDATWERLAQDHDTDPVTLTADTGSGGLHVYYRRPLDCGKVRSRDNAIPPGVDCKCDGGYVVAPPSLHRMGKRYSWRRPQDTPQPAPVWLLQLLSPAPRAAPPPPARTAATDDQIRKRARSYLATMPPSISGSGGHHALWAAALALVRGFDLSPSDARALLAEDFNARCQPPWTDAEIEHKLIDADRADGVPRRYLRDKDRPGGHPPAEPVTPDEPPPDIDHDEKGNILRTLPNCITILTHLPEWRGVLGFDAFACREVYRRPPPWFADDAPAIPRSTIEDADEGRVIAWIQRRLGIAMRRDHVRDAMAIAAQRSAFHPVRLYLETCYSRWDQRDRLPTAAITYFGAAADDLHATAALLRWMIAAVKRVCEPGCQSDSMLVLEGEQGTRKSSALRALAGPDWFADDIGDPSSKDAADALRGKWVVEIGELRWRRSDDETRKAFLSRRVDHFRPAYGHRTLDVPRQCVLAASTNAKGWQTDASGARRYWAIACGHVDSDGLGRDRDQLWGEAYRRYRAGERSYLSDEEAIAQVQALSERREVDPWEDLVLDWVRDRLDWTTEDVLDALKIEVGKRNQADSRRICAILRRAGYAEMRPGPRGSVRPRRWVHDVSASADSSNGAK